MRTATPADAEELTRLRIIMIEAVFGPVEDGPWRTASDAKLRKRLGDPEGLMRAFVVEAPDGNGLAASAIGVIDDRLPAARNPSGVQGYVFSVATDPRWRRRGYARAVMNAVMDWFASQGIARVDLHASEEGEPLYRSMGFAEPRGLSMTMWQNT